ncbi:MAG: hypothetical protein IAF08_14030 [Rhizobacter sp.]|nr:hypothetical protein [Chlorobiales bacterium]
MKSASKSTQKSSAKPRPPVFREDVEQLKYELLVERMKFVHGDSDDERLHAKAEALIAALRQRRDYFFGYRRRKLKLAAAELIADPMFFNRLLPQ